MRPALHPLLKQPPRLGCIGGSLLGIARGIFSETRKPGDIVDESPHAAVEVVAGAGPVPHEIMQHHVSRVGPGGDLEQRVRRQGLKALRRPITIGELGQSLLEVGAEL